MPINQASSTVLKTIKNSFIGAVVFLQVFAFPSVILAQSSGSSSEDSSASTSETVKSSDEKPAEKTTELPKPGPKKPTGADSNTYTKNDETGLWENDKYTWSPDTKQTKPKGETNYSYNPATGRWDTTEYVYHPETGTYVPNIKSSSQAPAGAQAIGASGPNSNNQISGNGRQSGGSSINGTGPNSNNTINNGGSSTGTFDLFFNGSISNNIDSNAASGNATVQGNTKAGNALTGNADNLANVVSMLQSSWLDQNSNLSGFVFNVDGSVYGDLYIDPSALPASSSGNTKVDVNSSANSAINNNINVNSTSGNAAVKNNTIGGNAQSGDASAVVNLLNLMNSAISSGNSFLGILNINGNLNGDILLPQNILNGLIALSGPGSNNQISGNQNTALSVDVAKTQTINNNIDANAATGNASVSGNTSSGSATSGQAKTSTETINLVGQDVKAKNGLLVFINVLCKWIGLSFSPSSSAISNTGPNSNNQIGSNNDTSVSVNATENSLINNNVTANATSGDATVSGNTVGGNAKSGNANVAVNVLNLIDSKINVSDWFGVLFINVFGSWEGSFGLNTDAGNAKSSLASSTSQSSSGSDGSSGSGAKKSAVIAFVPNSSQPTSQQNTSSTNSSANVKVDTEVKSEQTVAGASSAPGGDDGGNVGSAAASSENRSFALPVWSILIALIALPLILFGEKLLPLLRTRFKLQ